MNILIVGFGSMGCRHAQALLSKSNYSKIWAIEPNEEYFQKCLQNIGATVSQVTRIDWNDYNIRDLNIDVAIVATSAEPRYEIVKKLLQERVKFFLLEKVVFQSAMQFNNIVDLLQLNGAKAYCNFVQREVENYKRIRHDLKNRNYRVSMLVQGGDFGLGCNGLHYLDLFEYLTDSKVTLTASLLKQHGNGNKRGTQYKELLGSLSGENERGDKFFISADEKHNGAIIVNVISPTTTYQLNEGSQKEIIIQNNTITEKEFLFIPTSKLTDKVVADIFENKSVLPSVEDVLNAHVQFFEKVNFVFNTKEICPIT